MDSSIRNVLSKTELQRFEEARSFLSEKSFEWQVAEATKIRTSLHEYSILNKPYDAALFFQLSLASGELYTPLLSRVWLTFENPFVWHELVYKLTTSSAFLANCGFTPIPDCEEYRHPKLLILGNKFNSLLPSFQEYIYQILSFLKQSFDLTLASDVLISDEYKNQFKCFNFSSPKDLINLVVKLKLTHVIDAFGSYDILVSSLSRDLVVIDPLFGHHPKRNMHKVIFWNDFYKYSFPRSAQLHFVKSSPFFILPENKFRKYSEFNYKVFKGGRIRFGAFCRSEKLNLQTVKLWSDLLTRFPESKLYFASFYASPSAEVVMREIFSLFGIQADRIIFFPLMHPKTYLNAFNTIDISLGAMPEQGGVSCLDSLMMGCPYVVCNEFSNSFVASNILSTIGLNEYVTQTSMQYFNSIAMIVESLQTGSPLSFRGSIRERLVNSIFKTSKHVASQWSEAILGSGSRP